MKSRYTLSSILFLILVSLTNILCAQVTAGPSDATTAPPASAASVGKILCYGQNVSLSGPEDANGVDFAVYNWYKLDASGNKQLTAITTKTYTETTTTPGYYNYELVTQNASGCTSTVSGEFQVYVLPQLSVTIASQNNAICTNAGTTLLTANITAPTTGYTFSYQWTRNGVIIPSATTNTYTISGETTDGVIAFAVNVSYALSSACTTTATQNITITPLPTTPLITAN
jgi:hypothetical protein